MRIPYSELSRESLRGIVEEFVSREGTEYGARDFTLDEKVNHVMGQLERGEVVIEYDPESRSCDLRRAEVKE